MHQLDSWNVKSLDYLSLSKASNSDLFLNRREQTTNGEIEFATIRRNPSEEPATPMPRGEGAEATEIALHDAPRSNGNATDHALGSERPRRASSLSENSLENDWSDINLDVMQQAAPEPIEAAYLCSRKKVLKAAVCATLAIWFLVVMALA